MPAAEVVQALQTRFAGSPSALGLTIPVASLLEAARALRDAHGYRFYLLASATERKDALELTHAVRNVETNDTIFVTTPLPKDGPEAPSLAFVWAGAEWHEREVFDLFGIRFSSHPDLRRILLPDDYEGHPLRKDFPMDAPWGYRPPTPAPEAPK